MNPTVPVITVDGPSGSGKGTLCKLLAEATDYALLDSGALYRLTALACINDNVNVSNESDVYALANELAIEFKVTTERVITLLRGQDVSAAIRAEQVGMTASKVAAFPKVRQALLQRQRDFKQMPGLIADGRDMGTVVFPDAELKVFLTASAEERAKRRVKQLQQAGDQNIDPAQILTDIKARDERDQNRATAPLKPAQDALVLDSTSMDIEQVYSAILSEAKRRNILPQGER